MDYGSTHVYMYESSDEEVISEGEYNEGMWLSCSDSEGEEPAGGLTPFAAVHPNKLKATPEEPQPQSVPAPQPPSSPLEGSVTKYQHLPRDESGSSSSEDEGDKDADRKPAGKKGARKKIPIYADLDLTKTGASSKPAVRVGNERSTYVKVKHAAASSPPLPPPPPRPPAPRLVTVQRPTANEPIARAPPIPPRKGIIKSRLAPGLNKMKRQRVRWEQPPPPTDRAGARRKARRADTNVLAVKFNALTGPSHVHTGDAVACSNPTCTAILSHFSQLRESSSNEEGKVQEWVCEFCGTSTEVDIAEEERPTKADTTYLITPATVEGGGAVGGGSGVDDAMVIFCIDISGSMCVTTEVPGKFELRGHERTRGLGSLNVDRQQQYLPRQRRDVTYVSRLQAVQAAVDHQLQDLSHSHPTQRVALISFGDEVTVIGDGKGEVVTVAGDKLFNSDSLVKSGSEAPLPLPVKDTYASLSQKVFDLEEGGQTALGPALLLAVSMASRTPGSKVIICTDGLANKGVGTLDELLTDEAQAEVQTFYEDLGGLALEKNVTVSLVSIKGTDCRVMELGQVADKTGGQVTIVDPLNITKEFSSILANPVIATDVTTKIILHRDLYFRTEESKESLLAIPVGNVTAQTELTYEYGVRRKGRKEKKESEKAGASGGATAGGGASAGVEIPPLMVEGKPHLPFQLQIEYTGRDGSRCMRVITQAKPITTDRGVAERDIDMSVVGAHVAHSTAALAMGGEYSQARLSALSSQRLLQKASRTTPMNRHMYNNLMEDLIPLENVLRDRQVSERTRFGRQYSDDESEFTYDQASELMATELASERRMKSEPAQKMLRPIKKKKKAISRRKEVSDDLATYCYQMKSSRSSDYADINPQDSSDSGES